MIAPRFAVILPACNEEEALPLVLGKLRNALDAKDCEIVVGVNGCTDQTALVAKNAGAIVAQSALRGYGHGCQAAIDAVIKIHPSIEAFLFFAADGANDPVDLLRLVAEYEAGHPVVLGQRTRLPSNWKISPSHIIANRTLGAWCGLLTRRFFCDLGPLRLISRPIFDALEMREWTYGWTIEPQILCARMKISVREIDVAEHPRIAGEQKVSGVSLRRTLQIGWQILSAGWRVRFRPLAAERSHALHTRRFSPETVG